MSDYLCSRCHGLKRELSRRTLDPPYCSCDIADSELLVERSAEETDLLVAISYAPLGVRDAARIALTQLLNPKTQVPRMLEMQAELNELRPYATDATNTLWAITGELPMTLSTTNEEAWLFLTTHGRVAAKLVPVNVRRVPDSFGGEKKP